MAMRENVRVVRCPVCDEELGMYDDVYTLDAGDHIVGCSVCLHRRNAWEWFGDEVEEFAWQHSR